MLFSDLLFFVSIEGLRFVKLALGCSSAIGEALAAIFIFVFESGPYVYVERASDRRSLLNGWRVPELRQCIDSMRPCQLVPSFRKH